MTPKMKPIPRYSSYSIPRIEGAYECVPLVIVNVTIPTILVQDNQRNFALFDVLYYVFSARSIFWVEFQKRMDKGKFHGGEAGSDPHDHALDRFVSWLDTESSFPLVDVVGNTCSYPMRIFATFAIVLTPCDCLWM